MTLDQITAIGSAFGGTVTVGTLIWRMLVNLKKNHLSHITAALAVNTEAIAINTALTKTTSDFVKQIDEKLDRHIEYHAHHIDKI